jgi:hypothetical protein
MSHCEQFFCRQIRSRLFSCQDQRIAWVVCSNCAAVVSGRSQIPSCLDDIDVTLGQVISIGLPERDRLTPNSFPDNLVYQDGSFSADYSVDEYKRPRVPTTMGSNPGLIHPEENAPSRVTARDNAIGPSEYQSSGLRAQLPNGRRPIKMFHRIQLLTASRNTLPPQADKVWPSRKTSR